MDAAVSLHSIAKRFGDHQAVDGLSLEVPKGTVFGLLGRNGAGKTTTIRMIMDIIRPDSGEVQVLGRPMENGIKDRIGFLPEERGLYKKMKVIEMLEFQGSVKGLPRAEARRRAGTWLDRLELTEWKTHKVEDLSKGMQQKAQFAGTILHEPELLILDEPFSGMDPVNQELFKDLIQELNRNGSTIIFSTHVMESAEKLCREIALIDRGSAVLHGPLAAIKEKFGSNSVQLEFDGDGSFLRDLAQVERIHDYERYVEIQMRDGADAQEILRVASQRLNLRRFEIMAPTLHNIFIQEVGRGVADE